jgi:hypothetical protein
VKNAPAVAPGRLSATRLTHNGRLNRGSLCRFDRESRAIHRLRGSLVLSGLEGDLRGELLRAGTVHRPFSTDIRGRQRLCACPDGRRTAKRVWRTRYGRMGRSREAVDGQPGGPEGSNGGSLPREAGVLSRHFRYACLFFRSPFSAFRDYELTRKFAVSRVQVFTPPSRCISATTT